MSPEAILDKVKKLLALSKSDNVAEAELALSRANNLIQKYNITVAEEFDAATMAWTFEVVDGTDAIYHGRTLRSWEDKLISYAISYMGGRCIITGWKSESRYCYCGVKEDGLIAKLIFWDINDRIRSIFKKQKNTLNLTSLDEFGMGAVLAIVTRLFSERDKMLQSGITEHGLRTIDSKKNEFQAYYDEYSKQLGTIKSSRVKINTSTH